MHTRRFPRTMQEAFGPYTSNVIHTRAPRSSWLSIAISVVAVLVLVACAVL